ncbi:MAG: type I-E CRISPR-associated endonuclease Cas1 [Planctomycetes bacterium]|nr:type I-E CRISPR-associated endonuclease Cas1 [Planctomycetota bacterium]
MSSNMRGLPPPKPIMMKERVSMLFLRYGELDVIDGAFVLVDKNGVRTHIPVGSIACLLLETGTRITHEAVKLASRVGCLLIWVGDGGVRLYSAGQPGGARADRLLYQAKLALDDAARLNVVRKMYAVRFGEEPPARRSIQQLRGIEGARVRKMYQLIARQHGINWNSRNYDHTKWESGNLPNRCLSAATACLYGITEAAILAAGYSPAIGFIHSGKPHSFVYDIADLYKFETVVPIAFKVAAGHSSHPERDVRIGCRDMFRQSRILKTIIPDIEEVLAAGGMQPPEIHKEAVPIAIPNKESIGDVGHRS